MKRGKSYQKDLVQYRLDLAKEMLRDARVLKENGGSRGWVIQPRIMVFSKSLDKPVVSKRECRKLANSVLVRDWQYIF